MTVPQTAKLPIEHKDKLSRALAVGNCVAYPSRNNLLIGSVLRFTPKMVIVSELGAKYSRYSDGQQKYPSDLVLVGGPEVTLYALKLSGLK